MSTLTHSDLDAARKIKTAVEVLNTIIRDAARHGVSVRVSSLEKQAIGWAATEIVEVIITKEL